MELCRNLNIYEFISVGLNLIFALPSNMHHMEFTVWHTRRKIVDPSHLNIFYQKSDVIYEHYGSYSYGVCFLFSSEFKWTDYISKHNFCWFVLLFLIPWKLL